jgi:GNAT superfamily N-acetyltransferase
MRLVLADSPAPTVADMALPGMEPIFWQGAGHQLRPPAWFPLAPMIEHLAYVVARTPTDLTAHTRRVLLCLDQGDPARIAGSLADLFIALGSRGLGLRKQLFAQAEELLPEELAKRFRGWLILGRADPQILRDNVHAVLAPRPPSRPLIRHD